MGHHTWFDLLFGTFYRNLTNAARVFGDEDGLTYIGHQPVSVDHILAAFLALAIIVVIAGLAHGKIEDTKAALVPEDKLTARTFVELMVQAVYGQLSEMMGPKAARFFLPLIGTCAFFIFFSNVLGLIPGFLPPTGNLNTTLACGGVIFVTTHWFGVKEHGISYFKHFLGPIIKWYALPLMLMMLLIETVSHVVRPISLAVRLAANMSGDHLVISTFLGLVPFLVPLPMYVLGTLVVVVQTLVFCLLSSTYISMAIAHEEH